MWAHEAISVHLTYVCIIRLTVKATLLLSQVAASPVSVLTGYEATFCVPVCNTLNIQITFPLPALVQNDFTPEEEEEVRRENQWAFD